ncbi:MAG TPA: hypothetical protein VKA43_08775 [Gammaproteobacteria bacterium]|nr:hypothetical protein [Gammaproteobacteria bacterium]
MSDRETTNDDEALSALLDDALLPDDATELRRRLDREPALRSRLAALEQANTAVRKAYVDVVNEPLPASVLDALTLPGENVVAFRPRRPLLMTLLPLAAAATIALVIGMSVGVRLGPGGSPDAAGLVAEAGVVAPGTPLFAALDSLPSAATQAVGAGVIATPRLTFGANDGGYCRLVDLTSERSTTEALACRRDDEWLLEMVVFVERAPRDGVYRPASGPSPAIEAAVDSLIEGEPLDAAAERAVIGRGWGPSPR